MARRLVTIREVSNIKAIEKADAIETVVVDGWEVVTKKNEFKVGDLVLYFEIDCLLPMADQRFAFLAKDKEQEKFRLRTIKLRGQTSQGLVLPLYQFPEIAKPYDLELAYEELLKVEKYEIPDSGNVKGCRPASTFPHFIPKTDEERIQNIYSKWNIKYNNVLFKRSLKMDGSSTTIASLSNPNFFIENLSNDETYPYSCDDSQIVVASRNQTIKYDEESHYWKALHNSGLIIASNTILQVTGRQLALQGECIGPGIQGNRENLTDYEVQVFKIWDIDNKCYLDPEEFRSVCKTFNIKMVPQLEEVYPFEMSLESLIEASKGKNSSGKNIEGIVYTSVGKVDGETLHFKVINNEYLLEKDK